MAVQAQYPSNVLLLNRNGEESHDYASQPPPGVFLDQSHMFFNNGGSTNPRKRGRENSVSITGLMRAQKEPFCNLQQSLSPNLFDVSHLQTQQQSCVVVSTGLQLAYTDQQQKLHNHHHRHQQKHYNLSHRSKAFFSPSSDDLAPHLKQERQEMDQLLQAHVTFSSLIEWAEELQRTLAEKRQRHYHDLLSAAEETVAKCLREKEAAIENATSRKAELEARTAQLTVEAQLWQAKAKTQEATAASLQVQLQRVIMGCRLTGDLEEKFGSRRDGPNVAVSVNGRAEDAESAYVDPDRVTVTGPNCRACKKRSATVVILPCRHLCLCKGCDQVVPACPICLSSWNFSVEVNLS